MEYMSFLKERKSIRDFVDVEMTPDTISNIENAIVEVDELGAGRYVKFSRIEDPVEFYEKLQGKAGYAGTMIEAPTYIVMEYKEEAPENILYGAMYMEELITKLHRLGLGTCWVTLGASSDEAVDELVGLLGDNVSYCLAVGEPKSKRPFDNPVTSSRKDVDEIVFTDREFKKSAVRELRDMNMLELFSALRYAPSHKNLQPWKFLINDDMTLYLEKGNNLNWTLTDGGIVMYYFEKLVHMMGINGSWNVNIEDEGDYYKVGSFKL